MPVEEVDRLKALLNAGRISAITIDTNIFDAQKLNFSSKVMRSVLSLKKRPFSVIFSGTIIKEVKSHVEASMSDALRSFRKAAGDALYAFGTKSPTRDEIITLVTGGHEPATAAENVVRQFLLEGSCEVLDDCAIVDTSVVFSSYFERRPPFSHGKKSEFPDALALNALDTAAASLGIGILVVSEDGDWKEFCATSKNLCIVTKLEKALSLISDTPIELRKLALDWIANEGSGRDVVRDEIEEHLESVDVSVEAQADVGSVEVSAWYQSIKSIEWPKDKDINFIEVVTVDAETTQIVMSFPIIIQTTLGLTMEFSVWDGIDRETIDMGGRSTEVNQDEPTEITVTIEIEKGDDGDFEVNLVNLECNISDIFVDLGSVEMFEAENFEE